MSKFCDPSEAVTVPGDLDGLPLNALEGGRECVPQLSAPLGDKDLPSQDTVLMDDLRYVRSAAR